MGQRYNSNQWGFTQAKHQKIIIALRDHPEGLYPKSISSFTGIKINSCKLYLKQLRPLGIVYQDTRRGPYKLAKNMVHSMDKPRVQNLVAIHKIQAPVEENYHKECDSVIAVSELNVVKNTKIATFRLCADPPISLMQSIKFIKFFKSQIKGIFGYDPPNNSIILKTFECNWDYAGCRIDGASAITLNGLIAVEKIYNKPDNWLRHELKINTPFSFDNFLNIIRQGQFSTDHNAALFELNRKMEHLQESIKRLFQLYLNGLEKKN